MAVFFTLSGFLITALLLEEQDRVGRIQLVEFYKRRARRLLPAFFVSTSAVVALSMWLDTWWFEWSDLLPVLFYFGNWIEALPNADLAALGGTWSLAIEEQFYLVWPIVLVGLVRVGRRAVLVAAVVSGSLSFGVRVALIAGGLPSDRIYYGSDTVAFALLAGAALAAWRSDRPTGRGSPAASFLALVVIVVVSTWSALAAAYLALPVIAASTVVLLASSVGAGAGLPGLASKPMIWLGRRSYGIYLWHCPLAWALRVHAGWSWPTLMIAVVPVSLILAELSYRWIEQPWLRPSGGRLEELNLQVRPPARPVTGVQPPNHAVQHDRATSARCHGVAHDAASTITASAASTD